MKHPHVNITVTENADGTVEFTVTSVQNVDSLRIRAKSKEGGSVTANKVGDSIKLTGPTVHQICAVTDETVTVLHEYSVATSSDSQKLSLTEDSTVNIEQVVDRYVRGDTWELELENELEIATTE